MNNRNEYPMACEYLGRVREAERHVDWLRQRKENLQLLLTDTSVHYTDMPHSDSPDLQKHQTIQAEIDELEREITEAEAAVGSTKDAIGITLSRLTEPMGQRALILHYLNGQRWKDVAETIQFSIAHTYRFRDAGLAELEEMLQAAA